MWRALISLLGGVVAVLSQGCENISTLTAGTTLRGISGEAESLRLFCVEIPADFAGVLETYGGTGQIELYGASNEPTLDSYDQKSADCSSNNEKIVAVFSESYHFLIFGVENYTDVVVQYYLIELSELQDGATIPVEDNDSEHYYYISNAANIGVTLTYEATERNSVQFLASTDAPPTIHRYIYVGGQTDDETEKAFISIPASGADIVFILVDFVSKLSGFSFEVAFLNMTDLLIPQTGLSGPPGFVYFYLVLDERQGFTLDHTASAEFTYFHISFNSIPTEQIFDTVSSFEEGRNTLTVSELKSGVYCILMRAYVDYVNIDVSTTTFSSDLSDGITIDELYDEFSPISLLFVIEVPEDHGFVVSISNPNSGGGCADDPTWASDWGDCLSYGPGGDNDGFCFDDYDANTFVGATDGCPVSCDTCAIAPGAGSFDSYLTQLCMSFPTAGSGELSSRAQSCDVMACDTEALDTVSSTIGDFPFHPSGTVVIEMVAPDFGARFDGMQISGLVIPLGDNLVAATPVNVSLNQGDQISFYFDVTPNSVATLNLVTQTSAVVDLRLYFANSESLVEVPAFADIYNYDSQQNADMEIKLKECNEANFLPGRWLVTASALELSEFTLLYQDAGTDFVEITGVDEGLCNCKNRKCHTIAEALSSISAYCFDDPNWTNDFGQGCSTYELDRDSHCLCDVDTGTGGALAKDACSLACGTCTFTGTRNFQLQSGVAHEMRNVVVERTSVIILSGPSPDSKASLDCMGGQCFGSIGRNAKVQLRNLIIHNYTDQNGGIAQVSDEVTVELDNVVLASGGTAFLNHGGDIIMNEVTSENPLGKEGSVISNEDDPTSAVLNVGNVRIYNSVVRDCIGHDSTQGVPTGGFVSSAGGEVVIESTTVENCSVSEGGHGGAVFVDNTHLELRNSSFFDCSSDKFGGAVDIAGKSIARVSKTSFTGCSALYGGGMAIFDSVAIASDLSFHDCHGVLGGGLDITYSEESTLGFANVPCDIEWTEIREGYWFSLRDSVFEGCQARHGGGINMDSVSETPSAVLIVNVEIMNCSVTLDGGGLNAYYTSTTIQDMTIERCFATEDGGGILLFTSPMSITDLRMSDCNSEGRGGGIMSITADDISGDSTSPVVTLTDIQISSCFAHQGGAISVLTGEINAHNVTIEDCQAVFGGAIYSIDSTMTMTSCIIDECMAWSRAGAFYAFDNTIMNFFDGSIRACEAATGGGVYVLDSLINIESSDITNCSAPSGSGGGLYFDAESSGILARTNIVQNHAATGGGAFALDANVDLEDVTFDGNSADSQAGFHIGSATNVYILNSRFLNNVGEVSGGGLGCVGPVNILEVTASLFHQNRASIGGGIYSSGCTFTIQSSNFTNNQATTSGAGVYSLQSNIDLLDCHFDSNVADDSGGALYVTPGESDEGVPNTVITSHFARNSAAHFGGALASIGNNTIEFLVLPTLTTMNSNNASGGGAIYWDVVQPGWAYLVKFGEDDERNVADYGPNYASEAKHFVVASDIPPTNETSGEVFNFEIQVHLRDFYNQIVASDQRSIVTALTVERGAMVGSPKCTLKDGVCIFSANNDTGIGVKYQPQSLVSFLFKIEDVRDKFGNEGTLETDTHQVALRPCRAGEQMSSNKDKCERCPEGTFSKSEGAEQCAKCPAFSDSVESRQTCACYSDFLLDETALELLESTHNDNAAPCVDCPEGANCSSGEASYTNVEAATGYWKVPEKWVDEGDRVKFVECIIEDACPNDNGTCADHHEGTLCALCEEGFAPNSQFGCGPCPSKTLGIIRLVGLTILYITYLGVSCYLALKDSLRLDMPEHSILLKIFTTGIQTNAIALRFKYKWPIWMGSFWQILQAFVDPSGTVFSFSCFNGENSIDPFYVKGIVFLTGPVSIFLLPLIPLTIRYCMVKDRKKDLVGDPAKYLNSNDLKFTVSSNIGTRDGMMKTHGQAKKEKESKDQIEMYNRNVSGTDRSATDSESERSVQPLTQQDSKHIKRAHKEIPTTSFGLYKAFIKSRYFCCIFVCFFILNLPIAVQTFQMFNCHEVTQKYHFLFLAPNQQCYGNEHRLFTFAIAVPCLLLWVVGAPTICFLLLRRNRADKDYYKSRIRYSFLFRGYKKENYYWEFVILFRKMCIAVIAAFFAYDGRIQAFMACFVLSAWSVWHRSVYPYIYDWLNVLESFSLGISFLTYFFGILLYFDLSNGTQAFISVIILLLNVLFIVLVLVAAVNVAKHKVTAFMEKRQLESPKYNQKHTPEKKESRFLFTADDGKQNVDKNSSSGSNSEDENSEESDSGERDASGSNSMTSSQKRESGLGPQVGSDVDNDSDDEALRV